MVGSPASKTLGQLDRLTAMVMVASCRGTSGMRCQGSVLRLSAPRTVIPLMERLDRVARSHGRLASERRLQPVHFASHDRALQVAVMLWVVSSRGRGTRSCSQKHPAQCGGDAGAVAPPAGGCGAR